eukprot:Partr_v1_DN28337_c0_g1_i1_m79235 putative Fumarylacetoacetase
MRTVRPCEPPKKMSILQYAPETDFPIENVPFGVFSPRGSGIQNARVGTRIGDTVVDLSVLADSGLLIVPGLPSGVFKQSSLNAYMSLGKSVWTPTRKAIQKLLSTADTNAAAIKKASHAASEVDMHLPCVIGDYTDFYASKEHATNVGIMFRGKENALMPNWTSLPVGYHGRASSIVVSGTPITRPCGQRNSAAKGDAPKPVYGPSIRMDFELEMAFIIGTGNQLGDRIPIDRASEHVFGVALMNDWSARDIQAWEYVPLGPFLGKNFGTTLSAWVVTMDALEPFMVEAPAQDPVPLEYLQDKTPGCKSAIDIQLGVHLKPSQSSKWTAISKTNLKYMYWSIRQQVAHHTVNGCNMRTGDLLATGTISGPTEDSYGSMLELSWTGTKTLELEDGVKRTFLEDGDELKLTGYAQGQGYRVGFGECTGVIMPAKK